MNIIFLILGGVLFVFGIGIILKPRWYSNRFDYTFDFASINIPLGFALLAIGCLLIWSVVRIRGAAGSDILICPKCEDTYSKEKTEDNLCPKCKVQLKDLKGFYDGQT